MKKDAFYFPHFANARHDRKLKRVQKELGLEGYAIYFQLLEILREQIDFMYPLEDIDLLADEIGTSEPKVRTVICNYQLFDVIDDKFFSIKQIYYLQPYIEKTQRARLAAQKRWDNTNDNANAMQMHSKCNADAMQGKETKVKESKLKEKKVKESILVVLPFENEYFSNYWEMWKDYKKKQFKFTYATPQSEQAALKDLVNLSNGEETIALKIIEQSMAKGWKGFFTLKNELNATGISNNRKPTFAEQQSNALRDLY